MEGRRCEYFGQLCGDACVHKEDRTHEKRGDGENAWYVIYESTFPHFLQNYGGTLFCAREKPGRDVNGTEEKQVKMQLLPFREAS